MNWLTFALFLPACFALNMVPGPNNLLSMNNARRYGIATACAAGLGRLIAFVGMISLSATGLATLLYASENLFLLIKLAGAEYLFYLAFQLWRAGVAELDEQMLKQHNLAGLMRQEFWLAAGNPKAILIFTAFLPQFIDLNANNVGGQFFVLGSLFIILECVAIVIYALLGSWLRQWFAKPSMKRLFNRACASFLATAGVGLLVAKRSH